MQDKLQAVSQLLELQEPQKAEMMIARLLRTDLSHEQIVELLQYRAQASLLGGNPERALKDLETLKGLMPDAANRPEILEVAADSYFAKYEQAAIGFTDKILLRKAQQLYESVLQGHPAYNNLGWVLYQYGRTYLVTDSVEQALEHFQRALNSPSRQDTLKAYCYERMGFVEYYSHHNFSRALEFLNLAVAIYPSQAEPAWLVQTHLLRSRVFHAAGQTHASAQAVDTAIGIAEARIKDRSILGEAFFAGGELMAQLDGYEGRAIQLMEMFKQSRTRPTGVSVTWSRAYEITADLYLKVDRYAEAAQAYQAALQFNPYHPWESTIRYRLAKCYYQLGRYVDVVNLLEKLLASEVTDNAVLTDYRVYDLLASARFALEHYAEAAEAYATALSLAQGQTEGVDKIKLYYHFSRQLAGHSDV